jgi:hypothetical protein
MANGALTLEPIVLYAEKEVVFVTSYKAGSFATPLPVRGDGAKIEVTFSEPIEAASFNAYLQDYDGVGFHPVARGYASVRLNAKGWSKDGKTVTLVAAEAPKTGYATTSLPFNVLANATDFGATGYLKITAKKADGTETYVVTEVPVFTEERIKLLSVDIVEPTDPALVRPARALHTVKLNGAVKLTFSKPVAANDTKTEFWFQNSGLTGHAIYGDPDYKVDGNVVYVYVDQKIPLSTFGTDGLFVGWNVAAADHPDDFVENGTTVGFTITTDGLQKLIVSGTNLYDPNPAISLDATDHVQQSHSYFPVDSNIEITFTRNIGGQAKKDGTVEGACTAEAELFIGGAGYNHPVQTNKVALADTDPIVVKDNKVIIDPKASLQPNTQYYLSLTIKDAAGDIIYTTEGLEDPTGLIYVDDVAPVTDHISFTTAQQVFKLTSTNLYDTRYIDDISTISVTPYFPISGKAIELTFDRPIPVKTATETGATEILAVLQKEGAVPDTWIDIPLKPVEIAGAVVKITPLHPLDPGTDYYLAVTLKYGSQALFDIYDIKNNDWNSWQGETIAIKGAGAIQFRTENVFTATGTNIKIGVAPAPNTLPADSDILLFFNKTIDVETFEAQYKAKSKLSYKVGGTLYTVSDVTFVANDKTVTIKPKYTLAPGAEFEITLYVPSKEDGEELLVFDSQWLENEETISPYAKYNDSFPFTAGAVEHQVSGPEVILRSQKPVKYLDGTAPVEGTPPPATITTIPTSPRSGEEVDLSWPNPVDRPVPAYLVYSKWQSSFTWNSITGSVTLLPSNAPNVYAVRTPAVIPPTNSLTAPLDYLIMGVDAEGYATQSYTTVTVKGPKLALDDSQVNNVGKLLWNEYSTNANFYGNKDIVLVFNKDVDSITSKAFYYDDGGVLRLNDDVTFTAKGKTVVIHPPNTLVASASFQIAIQVKATDNDTVEYNALKDASSTDVATVNPYYLSFTTGAAPSSAPPIVQPILLPVTAVDDETHEAITGSLENSTAAIALSLPSATADMEITAIQNRYIDDVWTGTPPNHTRVPSLTNAATVVFELSGTGTENLIADASSDAKTIVYRVTAQDKRGFALEGTTAVTVRAKRIDNFSTLKSSGSDLDLTVGGNYLGLEENIVLTFSKPVTLAAPSAEVPTETKLYYRDGLYLYELASPADYTIIENGVYLIVKPTNVLAPNETFELKLNVVSADGEQLVFDDSIITPVANHPTRTEKDNNIVIGTAAAGSAPVVAGTKAIRDGLSMTFSPAGNLPVNTDFIDLTWNIPIIPVAQTPKGFTLYNKEPQGSWQTIIGTPLRSYSNTTAGTDTATVNAALDSSTTNNLILTIPHTKKIQYILQGSDAKGFLVQGTTTIVFTP